MRKDRTCPKCRGRRFFVAPEATIADPAVLNQTAPLAFAAELVTKSGTRTLFPSKERLEARIEAWICDGCGFAELYATDLDVLRQMVDRGARSLELVDESIPSGGAFR